MKQSLSYASIRGRLLRTVELSVVCELTQENLRWEGSMFSYCLSVRAFLSDFGILAAAGRC